MPASGLPWEFHDRMRSTLLVLLVYGLAKVLAFFNLYNPFTLTFLLRLITGIVSWYVTSKVCLLLLPKLKTETAKKIFVLMAMLMWYVPYLSVRYTPENISGILLLLAFYGITKSEQNNKNVLLNYALAGLLLGISFFIRIQISFALAGFFAWLLFINKTRGKYIVAMLLPAIAAIGLNIVADHWFYGEWALTPVNYFVANIIEHKAAQFGTEPWWFYFFDFLNTALPPLSIILLLFFFAGIVKNMKDPFVWAIIPFILVHFAIAHKELRFLFPVSFMFFFIAGLGVDFLITKPWYQKAHKYVYAVLLIIAIPMLGYRTFNTATTTVNYYRYFYYNANEKGTPVFYNPKDYENHLYHLDYGFYMNGNLVPFGVDSAAQISRYIDTNHPLHFYFFGKKYDDYFANVKGYSYQMVYCIFPDWILKNNLNNWQSRSSIWRVYYFTRN